MPRASENSELVRIYIGVGTNVNRRYHIKRGMRGLTKKFRDVRRSTIYENEAVGFSGDNFYNFVVGCDTRMGLKRVISVLRQIENENGRDRSQPRFSNRNLDLDLLLYGDLVLDAGPVQLPRPDIEQYAYVLRPLAEIAGELRHPVTGKSYAEMWSEFDQSGQELWPAKIGLL